jgi:hypothetical protein
MLHERVVCVPESRTDLPCASLLRGPLTPVQSPLDSFPSSQSRTVDSTSRPSECPLEIFRRHASRLFCLAEYALECLRMAHVIVHAVPFTPYSARSFDGSYVPAFQLLSTARSLSHQYAEPALSRPAALYGAVRGDSDPALQRNPMSTSPIHSGCLQTLRDTYTMCIHPQLDEKASSATSRLYVLHDIIVASVVWARPSFCAFPHCGDCRTAGYSVVGFL